MALGLNGFLYDTTVDGKTTNFKFWDPEDSTNSAEVSVGDKEVDSNTDSRNTSEYAYGLVSKQLNAKRDERLKSGADAFEAKRLADAAKVREVQNDFLAKSSEQAVTPVSSTKDSTVYNTSTPEDKKK